MGMRMSQRRLPWYRWRFNVPIILFIILFGGLAWESLGDDDFSLGLRLHSAILFAILAVMFAWLQWLDCQHPRGRMAESVKRLFLRAAGS